MPKRTTKVLDTGSGMISKFDKARDGWLMKIIRRVRKWPIIRHIRADWLSVGRMIIAVVNIILFALFIKSGEEKFISLILVFTISAYLSDLIDGSWARVEIEDGTKDENSSFGALIDNAADKAICIPSMLFVMYLLKVYWVPIVIIALEGVLGLLRIIIVRKYKIEVRANHYGQMKNWAHGFGICFILLELTVPGMAYIGYNMLKWVAIPITIISLVNHIGNVRPQIRELKRASN